MFTNDNPVLVEIVKNAIVRNGVERIPVLTRPAYQHSN